jgi:hypothetical protein
MKKRDQKPRRPRTSAAAAEQRAARWLAKLRHKGDRTESKAESKPADDPPVGGEQGRD